MSKKRELRNLRELKSIIKDGMKVFRDALVVIEHFEQFLKDCDKNVKRKDIKKKN